MTRLADTHKAISVLVILWANLALQPCAIASENDHDCPHCPPAQEDEMAAHHGHHGDAEAAQPCATMQSDCCDQPEANVGERNAQLKIKNVFEQPALVSVEAPWLSRVAVAQAVFATGPPPPLAASPPLHLLHCVFLK